MSEVDTSSVYYPKSFFGKPIFEGDKLLLQVCSSGSPGLRKAEVVEVKEEPGKLYNLYNRETKSYDPVVRYTLKVKVHVPDATKWGYKDGSHGQWPCGPRNYTFVSQFYKNSIHCNDDWSPLPA